MRMHDDEVAIDGGLVRRLVAAQFPELAGLPVTEVTPPGTVNAIYLLGDQLAARLPRLRAWARDLEQECRWLPELARAVTLSVPQPVAVGQPAPGYPLRWAIYRWIGGHRYRDDRVSDERQAAADLARFVAELRAVPVSADAPRAGRRPLAELDQDTRAAISAAAGAIDAPAAMAAWERAQRAPAWDSRPAWIHADLLRPNLLVAGGRIRAVIDFGSAGAGDPATDVIPAWAVFGPAGRAAFRQALSVGDGAWERARGIALHQAAALIPYYAVSNPEFAALGRRTVEQVIADLRES
ncbi:MAG TPA: aminoglycoside phosphotransferase family protein [Streptosporangiaceae bacterium]